LSATADIGAVAAKVLKYQGLAAESIEVSAPRLRRESSAHFYQTRIAVHAPDSLNPEDAVRAIERALWPRRVIISAEDARDAERSETLSLDGHTVGELIVYHSPTPHAPPPSAPIENTIKDVAPPIESQPKSPPTSLAAPEAFLAVPAGLWAPSLGPIVAGAREKVAQAPARLAIIVDDGGYGGEPAEIILGLDRGLTFSVLPNTPHGTALAQEAARRGFEVMLHMPMDNVSPTLVHPGQIDARMDADQIRRLTQAALAQVPGAVGINNHTGSKFTADSHALGRFMEGLRGLGLYFVDSRTTPDSVAYEVAREYRIPAAARTLFLDNDPGPDAIRARFRELIADAKTQGSAIGICHFRPGTAEVLREVLSLLPGEGITLVHVSELVR
jgi:polysaccharide deacetylase 2 family uncharacterized protein YibQ